MALEALYLTSTAATKISILLFYRRLSTGTVSNGFLYSVYAAIAFVAVYYFIFMINLFVGCQPIESFWLQVNPFSQDKYHCINEATNMIAAAAISVVQDFLACGMPMVLFWKLRIPFRQKIALASIFGVGFLLVFTIFSHLQSLTDLYVSLCICGILRIVYTVPIYYSTYDMTWHSYQGWIWFAVESHLAVICASAPALKIIAKRTFGGSNWNSLQRPSGGRKNGYSSGANENSSAARRFDQSKGKTMTTMASSECLRDSEEGESIVLPMQDVELGYMDPEGNHVKDARTF
jgi:hypothetical protein